MPKLITCEAREDGQWRAFTIQEALHRYLGKMRYPECHGRIRAHGAHVENAPSPHFEHLEAHAGCPMGAYFDGRQRKHPHPLGV